mmetsp:Transcript_20117/g.68135  ORF Transcript_20117/g.68135 Transcript_20117/m.68135 type:complete len:236 (+) Transcript_20117:42-749(+)
MGLPWQQRMSRLRASQRERLESQFRVVNGRRWPSELRLCAEGGSAVLACVSCAAAVDAAAQSVRELLAEQKRLTLAGRVELPSVGLAVLAVLAGRRGRRGRRPLARRPVLDTGGGGGRRQLGGGRQHGVRGLWPNFLGLDAFWSSVLYVDPVWSGVFGAFWSCFLGHVDALWSSVLGVGAVWSSVLGLDLARVCRPRDGARHDRRRDVCGAGLRRITDFGRTCRNVVRRNVVRLR